MPADKKPMELPRLNLRAIAVGPVTMLALDLVSGLAVLMLWPGASWTPAGAEAMAAEPAYLAVAFVLGTLTTVVGGAVCARLAPVLPYWNAAAFGALGIAVGLLLSDSAQPWGFTAMAILVTVPAALYGAQLGLKRSR